MKFFVNHFIFIWFFGFVIISGCNPNNSKKFSKNKKDIINLKSKKNISISNKEYLERRDFIICPDKEGNIKKIILPSDVKLIQEYTIDIDKAYLSRIFGIGRVGSQIEGKITLTNEYVKRKAYLVEYIDWCDAYGYRTDGIWGIEAYAIFDASEHTVTIYDDRWYYDNQLECSVEELEIVCRYE